MKLLLTFIMIPFVSLLCTCIPLSRKKYYTYNPTGEILSDGSDNWNSLTYKNQYRVVNNVWNRKAASGPYKQRIFIEKTNGIDGFGWQWNWTNKSNMVVSYPEVIYGNKPWGVPSDIDYPLPIKAGASRITVSFDTLIQAKGIYNMAFSLWCVSNLPQKVNNITHEVMIWTVTKGLQPAGNKYSTVILNDIEYGVYVKESHTDDSGKSNHQWLYIAFVPKTEILNGLLVLSEFTDYLIQCNLLSFEHYITSIELGNEIVSGSGCTEIKNYIVKVTNK